MHPSVVLLPAPFGPSNPKNSPASTSNATPRTASTAGVLRAAGYVFTRFSTTTAWGIFVMTGSVGKRHHAPHPGEAAVGRHARQHLVAQPARDRVLQSDESP